MSLTAASLMRRCSPKPMPGRSLRPDRTSQSRPVIRLGGLALVLVLGGSACSGESDTQDPGTVSEAEAAQELQAELDSAPAVSALTLARLQSVRPVLKCVERMSGNNYRAHFGYSNTSSAAVGIPAGCNNRFVPGPSNKG